MPTLHGNLLPPPSSALKLEPALSSEKSIVTHSMRQQQPCTLSGAGKGFQRRTLRRRRWSWNLFSLSWSASYPSFTHPEHPLSLLQDPAVEMTLW